MRRSLPRFDVVLFDIDNVLIDTRASYLAAIQKTVEIYLDRPGIVSLKEIDQFKLLGGFNDDWDSCFGIITFLRTALQGKPIRFGDHRRHRQSISELGKTFPERPLGVEGLLKRLRVLYEHVETPSYQKVARIFQKVYLGRRLIEKERLVFPKSILQKIKRQGIRLGVVTGRNHFEAEYALKRFRILKLFEVIVTIDDVRRAEKKQGRPLRKPNPWPLLEAARRFQKMSRISSPRYLYVGDLPDDILAAGRAKRSLNIKSAAFIVMARNPSLTLQEMKRARPDFLLKSPAGILKILPFKFR